MSSMTPFHFTQGHAPLLISMPHVGTELPAEVTAQLLPPAFERADTDWHLPALYNMAQQLGASTLAAQYSRYVIDLNRAPDNANLYPGQDTTGLCPLDTFAKQALYAPGRAPDATEIARRLQAYWQPYHQQLQAELARLLAVHGRVVLWDAHSIASQVPRFFDGILPDLNFGTADQRACDPGLQQALAGRLAPVTVFTHVFNGRFKGGHITRHYGQPERGIHAVQLEMSQRIYMNETAPYAYRPDLAAHIQPLLTDLLATSIAWVRGEAV